MTKERQHTFSLRIPHEQLTSMISGFGSTSIEARQVARRLRTLLPTRFKEIKKEFAINAPSAGHAERQALADERYKNHLLELADMNHSANQARVQYETHYMLLDARRSLRAFRTS